MKCIREKCDNYSPMWGCLTAPICLLEVKDPAKAEAVNLSENN